MNNIKKNSARKECYKSSKSGFIKKKQNTTYFQHNKYNKYKSRYNYPNKFSHYSYEYEYQNNTFFEKEEINIKNKKKNLIEVNDEDYLYKIENKENISIFGNNYTTNTNVKISQEKTNEKSNRKNSSFNIVEEDRSSSFDQELNSSESNTIIMPNSTNHCSTNSQLYSEDKENIDSNLNYNNANSSNNINENNSNNEFYGNNMSSINITSKDFKEAFYVPKRLNNLYNMYSKNNPINVKEFQQQSGNNNFQNLSSVSLGSSLGMNSLLNNNSSILQNNPQNINNLNLLLNNNNNTSNNFIFSRKNLILNINSSNSNDSIHSFKLYDSHGSNSFHKMNSFDSFHSSLKTQISGSFENEKEKENTDILDIYVKFSEKKPLLFKIRRYDDMFKTVKIFCEINKLDPKLIRPFIIYIIKALNSIYGLYNLKLKSDEIKMLKEIKDNFYNDDIEEKFDEKDDDNNQNECQFNDIKYDNIEVIDKESLINEE